jgi:hypothetical protein
MAKFLSITFIAGIMVLVVGIAMSKTDNEMRLNIPLGEYQGELGKCRIEIIDPQDSIVGVASKFVYVNKENYSLPITVTMKKSVEDLDLLRVRVTFKKDVTVYSLFQLQDRLIVKILGQNEFIKGTPANFRIIVKNQRSNEPISSAKIKVVIEASSGDNEIKKDVFEGITDNSGTCNTVFDIPDNVEQASVYFDVMSDIGRDTFNTSVKVLTGNMTYLVTDKPIYQPGQTIHIRTLSLHKPELSAVNEKELVFEVEDSKGNKVFKKTNKTDEFGVGYVQFLLADEVNFGNYTIRAIVDGEKIEKTVKVEKYVLPKFKISLKTDKEFYLPGEKMTGDVDVQYFFGKPVSEGKVKISVYRFDVGFNEESVIEGATTASGLYHFECKLPGYFVGEPLEKGDAFVRLDIEVIDKANHSEKVSLTKKVVQDVITISVVPEGGALKPGLENRLYVLANYPDGSPCTAQVEMEIDGAAMIPARTDEFGIAEFLYTPKNSQVKLNVRVTDSKGESASLKKKFSLDVDRDQIIMRMARGIFKVGESIDLQFFTTKKAGRVYLDIIKDNQTVLTKSVAITSGKGAYKLYLSPDLSGSIWLHAYIVTPGSDIVRDTRFCFVHPANDLVINVKPDKNEYLPGEDGNILFTVTDRAGKPRVAALCVAIVDEAVFAVSELQPGLEKVYFMLEKEIMEPRYEIHGFEPANIVKKGPIEPRAENVMFSTLVPKEPYPVNYTTPLEVNDKIYSAFYNRLYQARDNVYAAINKYYEKHSKYPKTADGLAVLIEEGMLKEKDLYDPWMRKYRVAIPEGNEYFSYFTIACAGPDGAFDSADDITEWSWGGGRGEVMFDEAEMVIPMAAAGAPPRMEKRAMAKTATLSDVGRDKDKGGPGEPRVREYFPETFIFEPALITDYSGMATLPVSMPDAITTWRLTAFGSSQNGELGSLMSQIKVFQEFFVDIDLPVALTQGDEMSIPVALYNYLPKKQTIKVELEAGDWFDLLEKSEISKTLNKDEVSVVYFPIRVNKLGTHALTVKAYGEAKSDAIRRSIEVLPDGKKFTGMISDRLEGTVTKTVTFPDMAIAEANELYLRIYPGIYSQVVEGLDKMLGMPYGCFEQTSSVTYPNILILNYLRQTEQIKPETEMTAEQYISVGYQRLLSFEVKGGGFSWFGDAPANKVLTAYGVMEFSDMSKVYETDERVIQRTAQWLKDQQEKNGSWSPDPSYLHAESWSRIQHNELMPTAYVCWALGEIGDKGNEVSRGLDFLYKNLASAKDPYVLALIANAFVAVEPKSERTIEVCKKLVEKAKQEKDVIWWESEIPSVTFSRGNGADIEATGLAAYALVRSGKFSDTVNKVLTYIIRSKDASGMWYTTQGTIICLRTLLAAMGGASEDVNARIIVKANGKQVDELSVDKTNADVMQQVDLTRYLAKAGSDNSVEITVKGEGSFLYEIASSYYIPWKDLPRPPIPMFAIDVKYDRTKLMVNDMVNVDVKIRLNKPGRAQMVMIDLGLPPGFSVETPTLDEHVGKEIQKYSLTSRQIIIYLEEIDSVKPVALSYSLKAKYPIKAQVMSSRVYEYYNTQDEAIAEPFLMEVGL